MTSERLEELYLDYVNNFDTVGEFAEHYGYTFKKALNILKLGRAYNYSNSKKGSSMSAKKKKPLITLKMIPTDNPHKVYVLKYYHSARTWYVNQLVGGVLFYRRWEKIPKAHAEAIMLDIYGNEIDCVTYRANEVKTK